MGWRGINLIICKKDKKQQLIKLYPRMGNGSSRTWVNTICFDRDEFNNPTPSWKKIINSPEEVREVVAKIKDLSLIPIDAFKSNGSVVRVKELYDFTRPTYCLFTYNNNIGSLLVVGNKTAKEMEACGYTKKTNKHTTQESFAPLIVGVKENKTVLVNYL